MRLDLWAGCGLASCGQPLQLYHLKYELCYPSRGVEFVCDVRTSGADQEEQRVVFLDPPAAEPPAQGLRTVSNASLCAF